MKSLAFAMLCLGAPAFAAGSHYDCEAQLNGQPSFSTTVELTSEQRQQLVGRAGDLEIFLSLLPNAKIELQAYNFIEPSRSYATAELKAKGESVELSLWKREFWIEARCTKI